MRAYIGNTGLVGEYELAYLDIFVYLQNCNIDTSFLHEVEEDIRDMLLSAQNNNLCVKSIVGEDIGTFCKNVIQSNEPKNLKTIIFLKNFNMYLAICAFIFFISQLLRVNLSLNSVMILFLNWFVLQYEIRFLIKNLSLKYKGTKGKIKCTLLSGLLSSVILLPLNWFIIKQDAVHVNGYVVSGICVLTFLVIHMVLKKLDNSTYWYSYFR